MATHQSIRMAYARGLQVPSRVPLRSVPVPLYVMPVPLYVMPVPLYVMPILVCALCLCRCALGLYLNCDQSLS